MKKMISLFKERILTLYRYRSKLDRFNLWFAILILLQFVIITLFQSKLSFRNYGLNEQLNIINDNCQPPAFPNDYTVYFAVENYMFIAYQLFLTYLGLNAIFNQYVMQICAYFLLNFGGYAYLTLQIVEVKVPIEYMKKECLIPEMTQGNETLEQFRLNNDLIDPKISVNELPQFVVYTLFVIIAGYSSLTMYSQIGFKHYYQKKVGNNHSFIPLLKRQLVLKLLLEFFIFFSMIYFIFCIYFFLTFFIRKSYTMALTTLIFLFVFISVLRLARLTFIYMDVESESGMIYFTYLWVFVLFNNIGLCVFGYLYTFDKWYFIFPYNLVYFIVSLASYICALEVKKDFGKGLKEAIESNKFECEPSSAGSQYDITDGIKKTVVIHVTEEKQWSLE